jgi:hypothetical protein
LSAAPPRRLAIARPGITEAAQAVTSGGSRFQFDG